MESRLNRPALAWSISRAKLTLFRSAFFGVLALDAWSQIKNASRYGAGGFNVAHFSWIDALAPLPTRSGMLVVYLVLSYLALRVAFGAATRWTIALATALFAYAYFISQLDSYQHHYLVFLLLVLCCCVPWPGRGGRGVPVVRSVALRLLTAQVAVVYLWTAIAKLDTTWLDGQLLAFEVGRSGIAPWIEAVPGSFFTASWAILGVELFLAVAFLVPRLHPVALPLGVGLHLGIEAAQLSIGLFSYYMFAVYTLLVPEGWIERAAAALGPARRRAGRVLDRTAAAPRVVWPLTVLGALAVGLLPFREAWLVAAAVLVLGAVSVASARAGGAPRAAAGHVAACLILVLLGAGTASAGKYYEFWGQTADHLSSPAERVAAYSGLVAQRPRRADAHLYYADALRDLGDHERALGEYRAAQTLDPDDPRAALGAAALLYEAGRLPEALESVSRAIALGSTDPAAYLLQRHIEALLP